MSLWKYISSVVGRILSHFHRDETNRELTIHVTTGDRKKAGTDANIWIILHDENGQSTDIIKLNRTLKNDHERGQKCTFFASSGNGFGLPLKIELWRDSFGLGHSWFLEKIEVEDKVHGGHHVFPVHRWIMPERHYMIREYDCCLPQHDEHQEQRRTELKLYKKMYQYEQRIQDGPVQIKDMPADEQFTGEYKWDIVKCKSKCMLDTKLIRWTTDKWESICDLKKVYKFHLGEPACLEYWNEDRWFGLRRVQGVNPVLIKLCKEIPQNFGVTAEMVAPFLEEYTLEEALSAQKIFIVDLAILKGTQCKDGRLLCCPFALFFLNKNKQLMPIAIQLFQEKGKDNPVFLPNDNPYTWLMAKIYYNNADASYHQSCTHLGFTHLLMEGVVICTHRNLSPSHPLYKLLAPHFLFLLAINTRGLYKLISPNGWVDKTMTVGRKGMFELIKKGLNQWHMNVHGMVPNEIRSRNVDSDVLPHYPYRDCATMIYLAIRKYVSKIIHRFYDSGDKVLHDYELQQWRAELVKDRKLGGCGLLGVPGAENNRFTETEEVVDTVTSIISTCSLGHAAANFQQYDDYAFPPNYPGILHGDPPRDKAPMGENDILNCIPNKETTLDIMVITKLLSTKATKSLGDFESQFMYHPTCVQATEEFREELQEISRQIQLKNRSQAFPYDCLDPEFIPNAISI
ncbi:allene oxide synthase-lipoxygenase protein isoform X1 [Parasteatoda tepidariorum]|uniref:allene oxide synthase-lipoxygenase protein isoform X1 n=3 Tax=Parasteatoda tepidariorum TaxID=114398 RepID=UPI001C71B90D|nr:allene oxide synthase-lipoxygenase protein isoform X1 [Parasteatoda tepidariorum]